MTRRLPHWIRKALAMRTLTVRMRRSLGKTPDRTIAAWTRWAVKKAEALRRESVQSPFGYTSFTDALAVQNVYDRLHESIAENMRVFGWQPEKPSGQPKFSEAVEAIVAFVQDEKQPARARLNAATWLLDTALGKH